MVIREMRVLCNLKPFTGPPLEIKMARAVSSILEIQKVLA
jgi:hypothetical protein